MTVIQTDTKTALTDNTYFIHPPERIVHTTSKLDTDTYGKPAMVYLHEGKTAGIAGAVLAHRNERQVQLCGRRGGKLLLGLFGLFLQAAHGSDHNLQ